MVASLDVCDSKIVGVVSDPNRVGLGDSRCRCYYNNK